MIDTKKFVKELKMFGVEWDDNSHMHWLGMTILTNKDMKVMCSNKYGREYDLLTNGEQRRVRESIFKAIRYGDDYEKRIK
jgi:hypothetical protein